MTMKNYKHIEARQRSVLSQSGQTDPSGDTGTAGAIDDPQLGIENPDQH